jgi:antitoxin (DNA-binding transcriptional repressor) of toxin-antitoxin stability system
MAGQVTQEEQARCPCIVSRCNTAQYIREMKTITQRELAARSKAVLDDVEAGEVYHITRNGTVIAEVRPLSGRRRFVPVEELQRRWRDAPAFDPAALRAEAEELFGDDAVEDDNPWDRG